ncbi:MAG TPA: BatD family protein [Flavobacterium sp.]|jgi:hypothetical protein
MKKYIIFLLLTFQGIYAQVQFEARTSRPTVGLNETLRVDFVMNVDGDNFSPPSFEGFRVVGGPSQQISQSWLNGRSSFNKIYSYFLMPTQRGNLTIRQAAIEYNGQIYKTTPVKVNVTAPVEKQRDPNDISGSADEDLHLVAEVSKTNPYLNEPITVVYKLYCGYNIGISNWRELSKPKYNDFWSQNIETPQTVYEENFKGERYRYVILKRVVLYPQKSGTLQIEPLALDLDVEVPTNRRVYGQIQMAQVSKRVSAGAKIIDVKPLPENGRPDSFSGAVGKFEFKVTPSKTNVHHGESLDLVVSVSGTGNLKLFDLPRPVVPAALEMYDPVHKENVRTPLSGMTGRITDSYTIVPGSQGNFRIQPMSFSYFDVKTRSYRTITSDAILIRVLDGPGAAEETSAAESGLAKQEVKSSKQFQFIKLKTDLSNANKKDFFGSALFITLMALPFLAVPLLILVRRRKEALEGDVVGNRTRLSNQLARKYLSDARKHIANKELFYISLERALHNFLKAKLHIETSEMSKEKIRETLLTRQAQPQTVDEFIQLTESCEFARYAPSSTGMIQHDYEKAVTVISALEKQI